MTNQADVRTRLIAFFAVVAGTIAFTGYYLYRIQSELSQAQSAAVLDPTRMGALGELRKRPFVAFRNMVPGPQYGRLAFASIDRTDARIFSELPCNRIHFSSTAGICLAATTRPAGFRAFIVDGTLSLMHSVDIPGTPSRARMAANGERAAYTVFVGVESYLAPGLSTRTRILDVGSGRELADLESFIVTREGETMHGVDFNIWGVTFTRDPRRFFATLGTRGRTYLVDGDLEARTLAVIVDDIECPSLSPDGMRIAFKKKFGSGLTAQWQPAVFDLASKTVSLLHESRTVDDQIEWLDEEHILYALGRSASGAQRRSDIWVLATDGATDPAVFLANAESPAVVRP